MNTDRIAELHEQASERYLNGDYDGALQAWRDVLRLDPANEQALDGLHMASQFVEPKGPVVAPSSPADDAELDQGLKILDSLGATTRLSREAVTGMIDLAPAHPSEDQPFGLAAAPRSMPTPPATESAAASELKRRVDDLLVEANAKFRAGDRDEAKAILSRLAILDEDNVAAESLRGQIEAAGDSHLDKVEQAIIEGVSALEADRLDDAEARFREALAIVPGHREALHYLEKIEARRTTPHEDLLGGTTGESAPAEDAVHLATALPAVPLKVAPEPRPERPAAVQRPEPPPASPGRRFALPSGKTLLVAGFGAIILACGVIALPHLFGGAAPKASVPVPAPARSATPRQAPTTTTSTPSQSVPTDPEARRPAVESSLAKGRSLVASGDFGGAVVAFHEVLTLDPGNAVAKAGFEDAGARYTAHKAEQESIDSIKMAFRDGEYTSGLRVAYRLPPTVSKSFVDGTKVAGWYNLSVVALRAGDCKEALSHLDEALGISPLDAETMKLRDFASHYADAPKDRSFLDQVEALAFRPLPPF
jgi:tetratricopeptide (TPR) repeat protein